MVKAGIQVVRFAKSRISSNDARSCKVVEEAENKFGIKARDNACYGSY